MAKRSQSKSKKPKAGAAPQPAVMPRTSEQEFRNADQSIVDGPQEGPGDASAEASISVREFLSNRTLTTDDKIACLAVSTGLCEKCQAMLRMYFETPGRSLETILREVLWKWLDSWDHGMGCPAAA